MVDQATKIRPVHEIRFGRIRAAIWENPTPNGTWHNVSITRTYRDGEEWKDSTSFGREDLLLASKVLDLAHSWIFQRGTDPAGNESVGNHPNTNGNDTPF